MQLDIHRTPIKRRSSLNDHPELILNTSRSSTKDTSVINELYNKFLTISKDITKEHESNFNMAEFEKDNHKVQYDQQMQQAKLKRLQNIAQLKRANYELEQRRKKSSKHRNPSLLGKDQENYMKVYTTYMKNPTKKLFDTVNDTDSEDESKRKDPEIAITGITHYGELKKHPKFLKYTLDKLKEKQFDRLVEEKIKHEALETFKNEIQTARQNKHNEQKNIVKDVQEEQETNPQKIADNIFRKIYTKRNKQVSMEQAKSEERIAKIIDRQDSILDTLDERSLSKQNYKKLKTRLGTIINQLYHDQKRHHNKVRLPKISPNNSKLSHYL